MVVFGAGASYDSCPTYPPPPANSVFVTDEQQFRPPLADELFQNRPNFAKIANEYSRMNDIVSELRHRHGKSVEEVLQNFRINSETFEDGLRQLAAVRYYLRDVLAQCTRGWMGVTMGESNYRSLLNKITNHRKGHEPVLLVTFNYDLLLDSVLESRGFQIREMSDYIYGDTHHKLFKLHGSVNWARDLGFAEAGEINRRIIIERPRMFNIVSERDFPFVLYPNDEFVDVRKKKVLFPALAIPMREKDTFECPTAHRHDLAESIGGVTKIIFIGWRAGENHFLRILSAGVPNLFDGLQTLESFMVISGSQENARSKGTLICEALGNIGWSAKGFVGRGGFSSFITTGECDNFLTDHHADLTKF